MRVGDLCDSRANSCDLIVDRLDDSWRMFCEKCFRTRFGDRNAYRLGIHGCCTAWIVLTRAKEFGKPILSLPGDGKEA